jgi:hypothetical protein
LFRQPGPPQGTFPWFDEAKEITVYVLIESEEQRSERLRGKENEEVLIGTELLLDCRLEIDFASRKLRIAKADTRTSSSNHA